MKKIENLFKLIGSAFILIVCFFSSSNKIFIKVCKSLFFDIPLMVTAPLATYIIYIVGRQVSWCKKLNYALKN
jgi:hypothetical protein